jgi:hypothetical protein
MTSTSLKFLVWHLRTYGTAGLPGHLLYATRREPDRNYAPNCKNAERNQE